MKTEDIKKVLALDPLAEAEKFTGKSYKEDQGTSDLGMLMHLGHVRKKENLLKSIGDTTFSMSVIDYLKVVTEFGFKELLVEDFYSKKHNTHEKLYVMYHYELGILLKFDTFGGQRNGGDFYYNWSPNDNEMRHSLTSSGSFHWGKKHIGFFEPDFSEPYVIETYPEDAKWDLETGYEIFKMYQKPIEEEQRRLLDEAKANGKRTVWIGNHDCREGLITNIMALKENGTFIPNWIERECTFWLMSFGDWEANEGKQYHDADNITAERVAKFPEEVQKRIAGRFNREKK